MPADPQPSAYVSNIQRFCVHDGPGIRTTVFLLGCPLRCRWCQNPETLARQPVLLFNAGKCAGCGACVEACPAQAVRRGQDGGLSFDRDRCQACGRCVPSCCYKARELAGRLYSVPALLQEILKDRVAFRNSGGGVTLSGGEPLLEPEFAARLLEACGRAGVHTAVETCGAVAWEHFERVLPHVDLFLYDLKSIDPEKHRRWTGADNRAVLDNARALAERGKRLIVRVPLIPGVNDGDLEFQAIARFAAGLQGVAELHLLPFHQVGSSKYALAGLDYGMQDVPEDDGRRVARCRQIAEGLGLRVSVGGTGFKSELDDARVRRDLAKGQGQFIYDLS
jgi:pyruvate formate lyase activating enzyme